MNIFEKLFESIKLKREESVAKKVSREEAAFNNLSIEEQNSKINEILQLDNKRLEKLIEKKPSVLSIIMGKIDDKEYLKLIDIGTKNGANVLDLVGKSTNIPDKIIVNIGVLNQPNLIYSRLMPKKYKDMVSAASLVELFLSDPGVALSDCQELETKIKIKGVKKDGKEYTRYTSLRSQLLRAINLYMRPRIYKDNGFDKYAKSIADKINGAEFVKALENLTSSLTTAANEVLSKMPEKAKSSSSSTLHNWNNRVAHKLPKLAKEEFRKTKALKDSKQNVVREKWHKLLCGLLSNPAINSFSKTEKVSLVKDCVTALPEIFYDLKSLGLKDMAKNSAIQLYTYQTFKSLKMKEEAESLLEFIGEEQKKKVLSRHKANITRKANKKGLKQEELNKEENSSGMLFDKYKF